MEYEVIKDTVYEILEDSTSYEGIDYDKAAEKIAKYIQSLLKTK